MAVLLMAAGAVMTKFFPVREWGIQTLSAVEPGLPQFVIPDIRMLPMKEVVTISLSVAVVIMAETLLAENNFAQKNGYRMNDNQEILHSPWEISWQHLQAAVLLMALFQELQWENSIRVRHS